MLTMAHIVMVRMINSINFLRLTFKALSNAVARATLSIIELEKTLKKIEKLNKERKNDEN